MGDEKTLKEIIREELKKLSKLTWGQRFGYILDYYKWVFVILLGILAAIWIAYTVYHNSQLEHLLNVYLVSCNSLEVDNETMTAEFGERIGGFGKNEVITIDTSVDLRDATSQYAVAGTMKLMTMLSTGDVDILILDQATYEEYQESDYFINLSEVLSEEQMTEWSELLIPGKGTDGAYGLDLTGSPVLNRYNAYGSDPVYGAVIASAEHADLCDDFFAYLLEDTAESGKKSAGQQ